MTTSSPTRCASCSEPRAVDPCPHCGAGPYPTTPPPTPAPTPAPTPTPTVPARIGLRATYPNADVSDVVDFHEWLSATEIAKRLGAPMPEVQKQIRALLKRGSIEQRGRSYRITS